MPPQFDKDRSTFAAAWLTWLVAKSEKCSECGAVLPASDMKHDPATDTYKCSRCVRSPQGKGPPSSASMAGFDSI
jgi:hypothetical protein